MIKAIETRYAGCRFRSRLEARWAVFFDRLNIQWEYEPQGFENRICCDCDDPEEDLWDGKRNCSGKHERYLPDFWLPQTQTWVEVKGSEAPLLEKASLYAYAIDFGGFLPHVEDSGCGSDRGLLILGPIPRDYDARLDHPVHSILQHRKGVRRNWASFTAGSGATVLVDGDECSSAPDLPDPGEHPFTSTPCVNVTTPDYRLRDAYTAARSARFEHGESGA
ncbi:hypothetical protein [Streptomyces sp. S1D4-20]|uniref:hypothetical protein n=1 Tax=Streptomyces sp. S1D4-20 TaxID=2594462 RepID=UPI001164EA76|nr:hypothetical protein [Streptomyces sp. S1D4-20]QDN57346.1 hypothetical protein FNV67_20180 [Streptomyces sp. S1D4-20]